jgi:hypothetical protein
MLPIYSIDPLGDDRWVQLVREHPDASIFHTPGWLRSLKRTYGYEPGAFTTSAPGLKLNDGMVFCRVRSWMTGSRLVSLPFSDHCQPLVDNVGSFKSLLSAFQVEAQRERQKYIELRPLSSPSLALEEGMPLAKSDQFYFHRLNLEPDAASLFHGFHKSCVQRKIRRAERENLAYESGRSAALLSKFYRLLVLTRRRHMLPPQPLIWFQNLLECVGDNITIHVVSKDEEPVASILTLTHRTCLVYKYGCSDERFHNLGGMPLLFWMVIQKAKEAGLRELDLGRSELDNNGLVQFKSHLGAECSNLTYYRYPALQHGGQIRNWGSQLGRHLFSKVPDSLLVPMGRLLYKHLG